MPNCPWYVSAHAVRRYMDAMLSAGRRLSFDRASDELIDYCARTWHQRYASGERQPGTTKTGARVYRGGRPLRAQMIVSIAERSEGALAQVVDVIVDERPQASRPRRKIP